MEAEKQTDKQLVEMTLKNPDCYEYIIQRYESKLMRYIRRLTNVDQEAAEDILQEVFLKAYKNLHGYDDSFKFSSWIYRITHNEVISYFRKTKSRPEIVDIQVDEDPNVDILATLPSDINLRDDYIKKEMSEKVREVITALPEKYRTVLVLRYMEDKSYDEIADILEKPAGTVATLISRAKDEFKKIAEKNHLNKE